MWPKRTPFARFLSPSATIRDRPLGEVGSTHFVSPSQSVALAEAIGIFFWTLGLPTACYHGEAIRSPSTLSYIPTLTRAVH